VNLGIEEEGELVETSQTVSLVEPAIFSQQFRALHVVLNLILDPPARYTHQQQCTGHLSPQHLPQLRFILTATECDIQCVNGKSK